MFAELAQLWYHFLVHIIIKLIKLINIGLMLYYCCYYYYLRTTHPPLPHREGNKTKIYEKENWMHWCTEK